MDQLQGKVGIETGHGIVENDREPAFHPPVDSAGGKRLHYIEQPEKKEPNDGGSDRKGDESHGRQSPQNFVDDDFRAVVPPENDFSPFRGPGAQEKESRGGQEIDGVGKDGDKVREKKTYQSTRGAGRNRAETDKTSRSHKNDKFVQKGPLSPEGEPPEGEKPFRASDIIQQIQIISPKR
jgi:hypothetical protein